MKEDLTLPEDHSEKDSKSIFEEDHPKTKREEFILKKQKEFEFKEVEGREIREKEKQKEARREKIWKFLVLGLSIAFLIVLYLWLLK